MRIRPGVQFHHRHAQPGSRFELTRIGRDEQRDANAGILQPRHDRLQRVVLAGGIQPAFGGAFGAAFRNDAGGVGLVGQRDGQHFIGRRHFEVDRQRNGAAQPDQISIGDVAAIFAQMDGDAVGAGGGRHVRGAQGAGMQAATRVADGGDMIDVDAKAQVVGAEGSRHASTALQAAALSSS